MPPFEYEGSVYIRPLGRGICLDNDPQERYLDDAIEQWVRASGQHVSPSAGATVALRIRVEIIAAPPEDGGADAP